MTATEGGPRSGGPRPSLPFFTAIAAIAAVVLGGGFFVKHKLERMPFEAVEGHEAAAIRTLRQIHAAQSSFRKTGVVDVDGDGQGEFGTLGELTGALGVRKDAEGWRRGAKQDPAPLPFRHHGGALSSGSYRIRVYLPAADPNSGTVTEVDPPSLQDAVALSGAIATDGAESSWCAYAWGGHVPTLPEGRTFFVGRDGKVLQAPPPTGATPRIHLLHPAVDGRTWTPAE